MAIRHGAVAQAVRAQDSYPPADGRGSTEREELKGLKVAILHGAVAQAVRAQDS